VIAPFSVSPLPQIRFGDGTVSQLPELTASLGHRALLVIGGTSFRASPFYSELLAGFQRYQLKWDEFRVEQEPSPKMVDEAVLAFRANGIQVVIGIGGGSVLDAAKAIAGLLPRGTSVMDYLEGVGPELAYEGPALPFIAVPTTAGTGSEATKNAVLSVQGAQGFKKSFRHDLLVPRYAVVDPMLLATCPPALIAANGMDALTQLLESLVSTRANPFSDALAISGLEAVRDGLLEWYRAGANAVAGRRCMAYAALLSGITLAQVGLGSVHGLASPLGAFFPIPHGVVCGTLVAEATRINLRALRERAPDSVALEKYAQAGRLFSADGSCPRDEAGDRLVTILEDWTRQLELPRLAHYGVRETDFASIVGNCRGSSMKTNPIVLSDGEVRELLSARL
jgi:alcohol dehydrogenase class IV